MTPKLEETIYVDFITSAASGAAADADSTPTVAVFEDANDTAILTPTATKRTSLTGNYRIPIACTAANGFEAGKSYNVIVSATIGGIAAKGRVDSFQVRAASVDDALQPTTAGRKLDVSAGGEAGVDWANVGSPTTTVSLSGTTVKTATDVEADTQDLQSRLPAALVSGRIDASVGAMANNTVTAAAIATDAIDADALASGTVAEIQGGLATAAALTGVETKIDTIDDFLDTEVAAIKAKTDNLPSDPADASDITASFASIASSLATLTAYVDTEVAAIKAKTDGLPADPADASDIAASFSSLASTLSTIAAYIDTEVAAIKAKTDNLPAAPAATSDIPTAGAIAGQVWDEALSGHAAGGSAGAALSSASSGGVTVYGEDGAISYTYTVTELDGVTPIPDCEVWVSSDAEGENRSASRSSDSLGRVRFNLDAGTVYVWRRHSSWVFTNPDTETVS